MAEGINLPSGYGGLMRFNEEYPSKLMIKPIHVVLFVILVILFSLGLHIFLPIVNTATTSG